MPNKELQQLLQAVAKTYKIDEGDANLYEYLVEAYQDGKLGLGDMSLNQFLEGYLIWANGTNWEEWLKTAQPGDIPPK